MSKDELKDKVNRIIAMAGDPEAAHSEEDDLHRELLNKYLPNELWVEIVRLNNVDFPRWCA